MIQRPTLTFILAFCQHAQFSLVWYWNNLINQLGGKEKTALIINLLLKYMLMKSIYFNTFSFNSYYVALNSVRLFFLLEQK